MPSTRSAAAAAAVVASLVVSALTVAPAAGTRPETLFPQQGVAGLDLLRTTVTLDYTPGRADAPDQISAVARLTAMLAEPSSRLTLDLEGLDVSAVSVDGEPAAYSRRGAKLSIRPVATASGRTTIVVRYAGSPVTHLDADDSQEGWIPTTDGAVALGEPVGTMTWLPTDNTPGDKFLLTVDATVPTGSTAVSNGRLVRHTRTTTTDRFVWRSAEPMSAYLAMLAIGRFDAHHTTTRSIDGRTLRLDSYVDPTASQEQARAAVAALPAILRFEERRFGRYPFSAAGAVIDPSSAGYALETQTRPYYPSSPSLATVVHETAHQWYGDSVTLRDWHDIWLAEGFATYAEWLWDAAHGGDSPAEYFDNLYSQPATADLWRPAPTTFTEQADLFGDPVYLRGAMTLQALREEVGGRAFFRILRTWARENARANAATPAFVALAERISGRQLDRFFRVWLRQPGKPTSW